MIKIHASLLQFIDCDRVRAKIMLANPLPPVRYSLEVIQEEVRYLLQQGMVSRHQAIYTLWEYFPARAWDVMASELERGGFLLRDRIGDLVSREEWSND